jgi:hypothetical protein
MRRCKLCQTPQLPGKQQKDESENEAIKEHRYDHRKTGGMDFSIPPKNLSVRDS